jgi:hypothetical protein
MGGVLRPEQDCEGLADALTMPPRKPTLSFGVTPLWPFSISDDEWKKLETDYGCAIPPDLRGLVAAKTQTMRLRSEARQSALSIREAIRQIAGAKRTTVDWLKWMDGLPDEVQALILPVDEWERFDLEIKPFMKLVVALCDRGLAELESDLASKEAQEASQPWDDWIVQLIDLFKRYKLPTFARKDTYFGDKSKTGRPSHFVIFIWDLQRLIERKYRQHAQSCEALADAINRARNRVSKTVRTRGRRANRLLSGRKRKTPLPNKPRKHR